MDPRNVPDGITEEEVHGSHPADQAHRGHRRRWSAGILPADVGTGSGVLALAALMMRVPRALVLQASPPPDHDTELSSEDGNVIEAPARADATLRRSEQT